MPAKRSKAKPAKAKGRRPAGRGASPTTSASPRRLGDGIPPEGPAPPSREPVSLVVARTDVAAGQVRLQTKAPSALRVAKGQVVHVKHAYRLQEHSRGKEECRFLLKSRLDGRGPAPRLARLGDQWGVPEDVGGYLQHEYTLSTPGRHVLEFEAGAEYCVMEWGDTAVQALDRKDLAGKVDLLVE